MKDAAAVVGIGTTEFAKSLEDSERAWRLRGHRRRPRRRRHRARRGRRAVVLLDGDHRGDRHRPQHGLRRHHLLRQGPLRRRARGAEWSARRPWRWPPASATWRWPGGAASGCAIQSRPWAGVSRTGAGRPAALEPPVGAAATGGRDRACSTRRYMHEYGTDTRPSGQRGRSPLRRHANDNPAAVMDDKPDDPRGLHGGPLDQSEPLCLFDNCLETDGACAVVITSAERARDLPQPPALVHAWAQSLPAQHQTMTNYFCDDPLRGPAWALRGQALVRSPMSARRRRRGPALRRVQPSGDPVARGLRLLRTRRRRRLHRRRRASRSADGLPVNTSGGGMTEAYLHGFNLIVEAVRQIRGTSHQPGTRRRVLPVHLGRGRPHRSAAVQERPVIPNDRLRERGDDRSALLLPALDEESAPFFEYAATR